MRTVIRTSMVVASVVALGLVMAVMSGWFESKIEITPLSTTPETPAGTLEVKTTRVPIVEQATGTVRASNETIVAARITSTVSSINVSAGDHVVAGAILIVLDARELEARRDQQRQIVASTIARIGELEPNFKRMQTLFQSGAVSKAEFDAATADLAAARAQLRRARSGVSEAETAVSYATISAPIDGRVIDRLVDPGDTVTPGSPLLRLYDPNSLRLEADVRESLILVLSRSDRVTVRIDALSRDFEARVEEIVPSADPGSRTFRVKVSLPSGQHLFPGMFGRLLIHYGETEKIFVPAGAVSRVGQLEFVYVWTPDGTQRRLVRTGLITDAGEIELVSGLAEGEQLVTPQ